MGVDQEGGSIDRTPVQFLIPCNDERPGFCHDGSPTISPVAALRPPERTEAGNSSSKLVTISADCSSTKASASRLLPIFCRLRISSAAYSFRPAWARAVLDLIIRSPNP